MTAEDGLGEGLMPHLTRVWSAVLEVDSVSPDDNFFVLGGDSLKATALVVHLDETYGLIVDPVEIFEAPVLKDFVAIVEQMLRQSQPELVEEGTL